MRFELQTAEIIEQLSKNFDCPRCCSNFGVFRISRKFLSFVFKLLPDEFVMKWFRNFLHLGEVRAETNVSHWSRIIDSIVNPFSYFDILELLWSFSTLFSLLLILAMLWTSRRFWRKWFRISMIWYLSLLLGILCLSNNKAIKFIIELINENLDSI